MSKRIITINRMYGSNGRIIGKALAEEMGIGFYDRELIELASSKKQVPLSQFAEVDEKRPSPWGFPIDSELQIGVDRYPIRQLSRRNPRQIWAMILFLTAIFLL